VSKEIAASRDESSWQVAIYQGQDGIEYEWGINPSVDALFSNNTYFPRTDLQIAVLHNISATNDLNSVSLTQPAVDGLSSYLNDRLTDDKGFPSVMNLCLLRQMGGHALAQAYWSDDEFVHNWSLRLCALTSVEEDLLKRYWIFAGLRGD